MILLGLTTGIAQAQTAGPPVPVAAEDTPARRAIALYAAEHGRHALPKPCRRARGDEITVCGAPDGFSPYRVPLPEEREPPEGPRIATGELPSGRIGGSPVALPLGVGLTLTVTTGKGKPKVMGNGDR